MASGGVGEVPSAPSPGDGAYCQLPDRRRNTRRRPCSECFDSSAQAEANHVLAPASTTPVSGAPGVGAPLIIVRPQRSVRPKPPHATRATAQLPPAATRKWLRRAAPSECPPRGNQFVLAGEQLAQVVEPLGVSAICVFDHQFVSRPVEREARLTTASFVPAREIPDHDSAGSYSAGSVSSIARRVSAAHSTSVSGFIPGGGMLERAAESIESPDR